MRTLDRKLLRDLRTMKGQVVAITLIIACGVASFVTSLTAYRGLSRSRDAYYARYRMADVFAPLKRAPRSVTRELERVAGVRRVQARIVFDVTLDLEGIDQPASGRVISVPDRPRRMLNDLHMVRGRWFDGDGTREVIVHEKFADEHGLEVGDRLRVIMNNRKEALRVVGIAVSPEYVYLIRGAAEVLPDARFFTVLWLSESFAEAVFDFEDACNDIVATIDPGARVEDVTAAFDRRLERYGGATAYARKDQLSNRYISDEIKGLKGQATMVPTVFLGVAAFVLHMLMGRLVRTQRGQIALFQAFGYGTRALVLHYLKIAISVGVLGAAIGTGLGLWFARGLISIYREFYSIPVLHFSVDPVAVVGGFTVSLAFAALGAIAATREVSRLAPAEGLQPESPHVFKRTLLERVGILWRRLGFAGRMIARNLARTKVRTAIAVGGVMLAASILQLSFFSYDSMDVLLDTQFRIVERQDVRIAFHNERPDSALYDLRRLEGVLQVDPELNVPVKLVHGWRSRRMAITGLDRTHTLHALVDAKLRKVPLPREGLLLSRKLADLIGAKVGDVIEVRVLTGKRQVFEVPVENVVSEYLGIFAYADRTRLSRWIDEERLLNGALLRVDPVRSAGLGRALKALPGVASVGFKDRMIESFRATIEENQAMFNAIIVAFAGTIVFGVIYNIARISLAERAREIGSLRVLGYTQREVKTVLAGENYVLAVLALPFGIGLGALFSLVLVRLYDTDLYRFPFVLTADSMLLTGGLVLGFTALANVAVGRRISRMDIVEVLKARE